MEIRPIRPDEVEGFRSVMEHAFGYDTPDDPERNQRFFRLAQPDRTRAAFDGERLVGTLATLDLELTVPGGSLVCAGTTMVAVLPTHRRRGILRRLITSHLEDAAARGEPLAALWASDSAIYGRFGYGLAALGVEVELDTAVLALHRRAADPARVQLLSNDEARTILPAVFDRAVSLRPGMFRRSAAWWELRRFRDQPEDRDGQTAYRYAAALADGEAVGYVQYRVKAEWADHAAHRIRVVDLVAVTPSAWVGLWTFLFSHDLVTKVVAGNRPADDPVFGLLEGPRRASRKTFDGLWVRILDLPAALETRRYATDGTLVMEVSDPYGWTAGVWRLDVVGGRATCTPEGGPSELALDIEDLGSLYLGRSAVWELAGAGRIRGPADALSRLDRLFSWMPQPWCQEVF